MRLTGGILRGAQAGKRKGLFFNLVWAACAAGGRKKACSSKRSFFGPAGTEACSLFFIWAACAASGRWGPVRGCRPSEAPSALPPDDPAGLSIFRQPSRPHQRPLWPALLGFPNFTSLRGLRVLCCGSVPRCPRVISLRAAQCHPRIGL